MEIIASISDIKFLRNIFCDNNTSLVSYYDYYYLWSCTSIYLFIYSFHIKKFIQI